MDMAKDATFVLDAAGVDKAHLFGVSLGGLLAEIMAGYFPERVNTILIMGSSCDIHPMNIAYAGRPSEENSLFSSPKAQYVDWMKEFTKLSPQTESEKLVQRIEGGIN